MVNRGQSGVRGVEGVEPRNERIRDVPRGQQPTRRVAVDVLATLSFTVRSLSLSVSRNQKAQTSTNKGAPPPSRCPCRDRNEREEPRSPLLFLHRFFPPFCPISPLNSGDYPFWQTQINHYRLIIIDLE